MPKLNLALIGLLLAGCTYIQTAPVEYDTGPVKYGSWLVSGDTWNLYTFDIEVSGFLGRAFIADNRIWTAQHIYIRGFDVDHNIDILNLGRTDIHGLDICSLNHERDSTLYYNVGLQIKPMVIVSQDAINIYTKCMVKIKAGDSGSPVLCAAHNMVVGIISQRTEDGDNSYVAKFNAIRDY